MKILDNDRRGQRVAGLFGALGVQVLLGGMFLFALSVRSTTTSLSDQALEAVTIVDLAPPPPPVAQLDAAETTRDTGGREGSEGEAPPDQPAAPTLVITTTSAAPAANDGQEAGVGANASGLGRGVGEDGSGGGNGGIAIPARRFAGALRDRDYPRAAERERLAGTVAIVFRVRTDGQVDRCAIAQSSGHEMLDDLTCRLFTERFRFSPALNAAGQPVETMLRTTFTWGTRRR